MAEKTQQLVFCLKLLQRHDGPRVFLGGENIVHDLSSAGELIPCGPEDRSIGPRAKGVGFVDRDVLEVEEMQGVWL